ncbi:hypothetical protein BX600DRAFT_41920 [Xylariales sp. PMI_506]|nr:hypothetical protein BX600DRAFT_41920 [Xylariales sp. PMI_506]
MPDASQSTGAIVIPKILQAEIEAFHAEHFSSTAIALFARNFLDPQAAQLSEDYDEYNNEYYDEEDGLGYYPDGVKRTLTDEQIAIFRHSELETLRRAQENRKTSVVDDEPDLQPTCSKINEAAESGAADEEEGELLSDTPVFSVATTSNKKRKQRKKTKRKNISTETGTHNVQRGESGWFKKTIKPDLRKRTWDVVETGMDSLDYDGLDSADQAGKEPTVQRRKVSYDD